MWRTQWKSILGRGNYKWKSSESRESLTHNTNIEGQHGWSIASWGEKSREVHRAISGRSLNFKCDEKPREAFDQESDMTHLPFLNDYLTLQFGQEMSFLWYRVVKVEVEEMDELEIHIGCRVVRICWWIESEEWQRWSNQWWLPG